MFENILRMKVIVSESTGLKSLCVAWGGAVDSGGVCEGKNPLMM
jgi:hypothetical protein